MTSFSGSKLALFIGEELLIYLRDEREGLIYSGMWDLPGGGREGEETPEDCVLRELKEEFDLNLSVAELSYKDSQLNQWGEVIYFFVAHCSNAMAAKIRFGDEGQYFKLVSIQDFLAEPNAIPHLQAQLDKYVKQRQKAVF